MVYQQKESRRCEKHLKKEKKAERRRRDRPQAVVVKISKTIPRLGSAVPPLIPSVSACITVKKGGNNKTDTQTGFSEWRG